MPIICEIFIIRCKCSLIMFNLFKGGKKYMIAPINAAALSVRLDSDQR